MLLDTPRDALTLGPCKSQTDWMPHIYMQFDFGKDEEKAQLARHKLEVWKQAFRLDKKLLYKLTRATDGEPAAEPAATKPGKSKQKGKAKETAEKPASHETVKILLRLAFSNHEKLSEQRWVQRIPAEDLFQAAAPEVVKPGDSGFAEIEKKFDEMT